MAAARRAGPHDIRVPEAVASLYATGVRQLLDVHPRQAREQLREVVRRAPAFAPAHAQLAAAELDVGDPAAARVAADRAAELVAKAPERWTQAERLLVDARRAETLADWQAAAAAWLALDGLDGTRAAHGVALAQTHVRAGQLALAKQVIKRLRDRGIADPALDLVEAKVADRDGELDKEIELGERFVAAGTARGSMALVGHGHLRIGTASLYLGKADEARRALGLAEAACVKNGDPIGRAEVERMRCAAQWVAGDLAGAKALCARSLTIAAEAGDRRGQANAYGSLCVLANALGEFDEALDYTSRAQALYRELRDDGQVAWASQQLGSIYHARGDNDEARRHWREGLQIAVTLGERMRAGDLAHNLGELAFDEGDLGAARIYFDQSLASYEAIRELRSTSEAELSIARLLARADTTGALERVRRSKELARSLREPPRSVAALVVEAHVALAELRYADASARARSARREGGAAAAPSVRAPDRRARCYAALEALVAARAAYPAPPPAASATIDLRAMQLEALRGNRRAALTAAAGVEEAARSDLPVELQIELAIGDAEVQRRLGVVRRPPAAATTTGLTDAGPRPERGDPRPRPRRSMSRRLHRVRSLRAAEVRCLRRRMRWRRDRATSPIRRVQLRAARGRAERHRRPGMHQLRQGRLRADGTAIHLLRWQRSDAHAGAMSRCRRVLGPAVLAGSTAAL